jgi:RNA polymerase sigma-70 factor (sigma-E family)
VSTRDEQFSTFVTARRTHLRRVAYAVCGDWHKADDILQTALLKAYVAWPRIHNRGGEEAYVRRIIVRTTIDESRRPWRRERPGLPAEERPAREGLAPEERDALIDALQELPEMQRKCVVLRHWLGLSVEETASELGVATGTVKSHTSRGVARLQDLLATPEGAS